MPRHHAAAALIAELSERLVQVRVDDGQLRCTAPPGVLTQELLARVRDSKDQVLAHLATAGAVATGPLSYPQQRLWLHQRLAAGDTAYHIPLDVGLRGALRLTALRAAMSMVIDRHDSLRTVFPVRDGVPTAHVLSAGHSPLPLVDLTALPPRTRDHVAAGLASAEALRPFDLVTGPVARATLLRLETDSHRLLITRHHVASDGWSFGVLTEELGRVYRAAAAGAPPRLPVLRWQYGDFARWQRQRWLGNGLEDPALRRWRDRLRDAPVAISFIDDDASDRLRLRAHAASRTLAPELATRMRRAARAAGTTVFTLLATALGLAAAAIAGQRDIVLGTPVSGRVRPETEALIGNFATVVPLRLRLDPDHTFRAAVRQTHETVTQAIDDQDVPIELILRATLGRQSRSRRSSMFQVVFAFQNTPPPMIDMDGLDVTVNPSPPVAPKYPLTVTATAADGASLLAEYDAKAVPGAVVDRLLDGMVALVDKGTADPERTCAELCGPQAPPGPTLAARFAAIAAGRPDAVAVTDDRGHLTYAALARQARCVAAALSAAGVRAEHRVGVHLGHAAPLVAAIVGVALAGAACVPLDPDDPPARHELLLADAGVRAVVTARSWREALAWYDGPMIVMDRLPEPGPATAAARTHPDHLAYVIYTSGSTGAPKGVMVSQRSVLALFAAAASGFAFTADDVWTMTHSVAFDFSVWELWGALLHGARVVVAPRSVGRDAGALWELVVREGVTVHSATPTALEAFTTTAAESAIGSTALRAVVLGGERCEPARAAPWIRALTGRRPGVVNMYGITETTVHVTYRRLTAADMTAAGSPIGWPLPGVDAHVVSAGGEPLQPGGGGELLVGGPGLARGYLGLPGLTALRFRPDHVGAAAGARLYASGDLAMVAAGGELHFIGRLDRQLKIRGYRIEPEEIAAVLARHPWLAGAALAAEGTDGRRVLSAYVVPAAGRAPPTAADLRRYLRERLPPHMVPARFTAVRQLPRTRNGKLDYAALAAAAASSAEGCDEPPRTATERAVARLWAELLGVAEVGRDDDFFALGGDSLLMTRMHARLPACVGVDVPIDRAYQACDVASLAALIDERRTGPGTGSGPAEAGT